MNDGQPQDLAERLMEYSLRVVRMYAALPKGDEVARVLGVQVLRSGTSPGAQHREARRARSTAEFISKMESAVQELDETDYWLNLLVRSGAVNTRRMTSLIEETNELTAIFTSSILTAKRNNDGKRKP